MRLALIHVVTVATLVLFVRFGSGQVQDASPQTSMRNPGDQARQLYLAVRHKLRFSAVELVGVDRAVALQPRIAVASFARFGISVGTQGIVEDPRLLAGLRSDLLRRAQLVAVADGRVQTTTAAHEAMMAAVAPALPSTLGIPRRDRAAALEAMGSYIRVVKPLCPDGRPRVGTDGTDVCVAGDPYMSALFSPVVPIFLDGRLQCTGTLADGDTLLTAAHCLIEKSKVIEASRLAVLLPGASVRSPLNNPRVPLEMLRPCTPPDFLDCADVRFDVGLVSYVRSSSSVTSFPSLSGFSTPGRVEITMAGYGATSMIPDPSSNGLYVGRQIVDLASTDSALSWIYNFQSDEASSICPADSGGPIFAGRPRNTGDSLRVVGVVSRIDRDLSGEASPSPISSCKNAEVSAVNLSFRDVALAVCALGGGRPAFCGP